MAELRQYTSRSGQKYRTLENDRVMTSFGRTAGAHMAICIGRHEIQMTREDADRLATQIASYLAMREELG